MHIASHSSPLASTMSRRHSSIHSRVELAPSMPGSPTLGSLKTPTTAVSSIPSSFCISQRPSRRVLVFAAAALFVLVGLLHQNGVSVPKAVVKPISDQLDLKAWSASTGNGLSRVFGGGTAQPLSDKRITLIAMW